MSQREMHDYAAEMTRAVGTLQARYPGRIPRDTVATLANDFCGERARPEDVREAIARLARASAHYDESALRDHLTAVRKRRELAEGQRRPALPASTQASDVDADVRTRNVLAAIATMALVRIGAHRERQRRAGIEPEPGADAGIAPGRAEEVWSKLREGDTAGAREFALEVTAHADRICGGKGMASVIAEIARGRYG